MSIIAQDECGFLLCSKSYFDKNYRMILGSNIKQRAILKKSFFNINTPFLTDSKSKKYGKLLDSGKINEKKKTRKKKILQRNILDDTEIVDFIKKNIWNLINAAKIEGMFKDTQITSTEWFENNSKAREAAKEVMHYVNLTLRLKLHFENKSNPIIQKFGDDTYVIPAECKFHLCEINAFIKATEDKFDLIVIDPPWVNRSVKRKNSYNSLKYEFLESLPFEKLLNPGCLIVVWVTNSSSAASFVLDKLFPRCNVILSSTWHWCKVTQKGDFVYPIDSHHKKPYENLILGRVQYDDISIKPFKEIDSKKLIVSVPSSIHSHKPPLAEILKSYVKDEPRCLELFARYLLPGWTSVGNEVLKLQNTKLFDIRSLNNES